MVLGLVHVEVRCCRIEARGCRSWRFGIGVGGIGLEGRRRGRGLRRFEGKVRVVVGVGERSWVERGRRRGIGSGEGRRRMVPMGMVSVIVEEELGMVASCSCVVGGSFGFAVDDFLLHHLRSNRCLTFCEVYRCMYL